MSLLGQKHRFDSRSLTSGLPEQSDVLGVGCHFAKVPNPDVAGRSTTSHFAWTSCRASPTSPSGGNRRVLFDELALLQLRPELRRDLELHGAVVATICCSLAAPTIRAEAISGVAENCSAAVRRSTPCRPATSRSFSRFPIIGCGILPTGDRHEGKPEEQIIGSGEGRTRLALGHRGLLTEVAAPSDAHLATDASRDLVVSGISACLSLLRLKLSCLKFPEDRSSTSALSENTSTPRTATLETFPARSSQPPPCSTRMHERVLGF
jgi:hypothetical protein